MYSCQQILVSDNEIITVLEFICQESNKLHNCATYYARQVWLKSHRFITKAELCSELKSNIHFKAMYSQAAQQTCHSIYEAVQSFSKSLKRFRKGELETKPRFPGYRKPGLNGVSYPKQALKLADGLIRVPLGKQVKAWFGIDSFTIKMPTNLDWDKLREVRFLPRNNCFYVEFVGWAQTDSLDLDPQRVLGIDPGLNNWLTCVSNVGKSFILDGKKIKSFNQLFNQRVAKLKTGKPQGFWSDELSQITEKRHRQLRDAINKAARFVINWCRFNRIGTLVFGWNKRNKDGINIGSKNNQEFVQVPTARLKDRIKQLCEQYGIQFIETEESYTSQASFLDEDFLPTYGEKPNEWKSSGKRVKRGLFRTARGLLINADCNGAANILRKVATQLGLNLAKVGRAVLTLPKRYDLFKLLSKSYRKKSEAAGLQPAS